MLVRQLLAAAAALLLAVPPTADARSSTGTGSSLTLVPPSPVSSRVML